MTNFTSNNLGILIPRHRDIEICGAKGRLKGIYSLKAHIIDENGVIRRTRDLGTFPNLITNLGLDHIAQYGVIGWASVGSGNTVPTVNDTGLTSPVAFTSTVQSSNGGNGNFSSAPYGAFYSITFRFAAGVAAGNLSEVGISWNNGQGNLFSHALILDSNGNPTTITVLSNEVLDVSYQVNLIPPQNDVSGSVTISGTTYSTVIRASNVSSWPAFGFISGYNNFISINSYSGGLGPITGLPTGNYGGGFDSASFSSYSSGSYTLNFNAGASLNAANPSGGIGAIFIYSPAGYYQCAFTPVIPKDGTKTLTIIGSVSWARD